jgi:DNA-binding CsgD family transcriptional regulator
MEWSQTSRKAIPSPDSKGAQDFDYLKVWFASRSPGSALAGRGRDMREEFERFFTHIFNKSKDGISIHALDFTIVGVNTTIRSWYDQGRPLVGRKCFEAYHGRSAPCENCPSQVTVRTGRPQVGVVPYQVSSGVRGDQELSVFPLFDENRNMLCVLEYVRDITGLEHDARIVESLKCRIQCQERLLEEQETALAVLLRQGHKLEKRIEEEFAANVAALVMPLLARLKARCDGTEAAREVVLLEERLREVASGHSSRLFFALRGLTAREQEVASLVRQGQTSKEISELLRISTKAVDFHRTNIRKKLGAERSAGSLRSLLLELEHPKESLGLTP